MNIEHPDWIAPGAAVAVVTRPSRGPRRARVATVQQVAGTKVVVSGGSAPFRRDENGVCRQAGGRGDVRLEHPAGPDPAVAAALAARDVARIMGEIQGMLQDMSCDGERVCIEDAVALNGAAHRLRAAVERRDLELHRARGEGSA